MTSTFKQLASCITGVFIALISSLAVSAQPPLPDSVDNSLSDHFPPIADQGNARASDWFAIVYYQMSYAINRQKKQKATAASTFSPYFGFPLLNNGKRYSDYMLVSDVYQFIAQHGSATLNDMPDNSQKDGGYKRWPIDHHPWEQALNYRTAGHSSFTYKNHAADADYSFDDYPKYFYEIKKRLSEQEILVIQTYPDTDKPGLLQQTKNNPATSKDDTTVGDFIIAKGVDGFHRTMAVVGYNDHLWVDLNGDDEVQPNETGALKIADCEGVNAEKHNKGFYWMAYDTVKQSIYQYRVNRLKIRENYQPEVLAYLTLFGSERDQIRFQFGRSTGKHTSPASDIPPAIFDPVGLGFTPGAAGRSLIAGSGLSFDGGTAPSRASFVFDLTSIRNNTSHDTWYLRIENKGKDVLIEDFRIVDTAQGSTQTYMGLPVKVRHDEKYLFISNKSQ